jgi:outer membrane lipoprotein SlyB
MKKFNITKTYNTLGKVLCGLAGGIIGFITGGAIPALLGIFAGALVGHLLEKNICIPSRAK